MLPRLAEHSSKARARYSPLLFVHGAFASGWCWEEHFVPFFQARGYDCLALSLRGHGDAAPWIYLQQLGIEDYVRDVIWACDQCSRAPIVVAHSMGGYVVQRMLQTHRPDLAGLVLMSPASPVAHLASALELLQKHPVLCSKLQVMNSLPAEAWSCVITPRETRQLMMSPASSLDTAARVLPKLQHESIFAMMNMLWPISMDAPDLPCDTLVLGGGKDTIVPPHHLRRTAEWLCAELAILPNLGHTMMLEDDWQTAATQIADWLDPDAN